METDRKGYTSDFIKNVEKIGKSGVGHYQSEIKSEDELIRELPFIGQVYNHKLSN